MPWEQVLEQRDGPLLESFWEDSVVGEEECAGDDIPGVIPWHILFIDENTHEFWNGKRRVCVIELDGGV